MRNTTDKQVCCEDHGGSPLLRVELLELWSGWNPNERSRNFVWTVVIRGNAMIVVHLVDLSLRHLKRTRGESRAISACV